VQLDLVQRDGKIAASTNMVEIRAAALGSDQVHEALVDRRAVCTGLVRQCPDRNDDGAIPVLVEDHCCLVDGVPNHEKV
jgi:hypothetical protein